MIVLQLALTINMVENNLIISIKDGDKQSFKELFDDYYPMLCVFAEKYHNNPAVCKDVSQEAFLKYWENRKSFTEIKPVKSYLYTIVRNSILNIIKKEKLADANDEFIKIDSEVYFRDNLIEQETYNLVRKAVDNLPEQMRNIIRLSMKGIKNPEIATQLNVSVNTVHSLKKRAYKKLRDQLAEYYYLLLFL